MRIVKLAFAVPLALYAVAQGVFFVTLLRGKHTTTGSQGLGSVLLRRARDQPGFVHGRNEEAVGVIG